MLVVNTQNHFINRVNESPVTLISKYHSGSQWRRDESVQSDWWTASKGGLLEVREDFVLIGQSVGSGAGPVT